MDSRSSLWCRRMSTTVDRSSPSGKARTSASATSPPNRTRRWMKRKKVRILRIVRSYTTETRWAFPTPPRYRRRIPWAWTTSRSSTAIRATPRRLKSRSANCSARASRRRPRKWPASAAGSRCREPLPWTSVLSASSRCERIRLSTTWPTSRRATASARATSSSASIRGRSRLRRRNMPPAGAICAAMATPVRRCA